MAFSGYRKATTLFLCRLLQNFNCLGEPEVQQSPSLDATPRRRRALFSRTKVIAAEFDL
jgi:hypothetical protein